MTIDAESERWSRYIGLYKESFTREELREIMDALHEGETERAKEHCHSLIDESGGVDATLWGALALCYMVDRDLGEAQSAIDRAMELKPEDTLTLNLAGDFCCFNNDFERGETFYLASLDIDQTQLHPRVMLSNRYYAYERFEDAIGVLVPILHSHPHSDDVWLNFRAAVGGLTESYQMDIANEIMNEFPNHYHAWCIMAHSLMRCEEFSEALKFVKRALRARKDESLAWNMYATLLNLTGKHKAALIAEKKSFELTGDRPSALVSLGIAHYLAGEVQEAMMIAEELKRHNKEQSIDLLEMIEEWEQGKRLPRSEQRRRSRKAKKRRK